MGTHEDNKKRSHVVSATPREPSGIFSCSSLQARAHVAGVDRKSRPLSPNFRLPVSPTEEL